MMKKITPHFLTTSIDRKALVTRHNLEFTGPSLTHDLQVGNGEFAFGVDSTGFQTFGGNTLAQWGWHTVPLPEHLHLEDFKFAEYDFSGRKVGYATQEAGQSELFNWLRDNPHRLNLGRIRVRLDGKQLLESDLTHQHQTLDLWQGVITSCYEIEGQPVTVETLCLPSQDAIAVRVDTPLISRLSFELTFPYGASKDPSCADWGQPEKHETILTIRGSQQAHFARRLDEDRYEVSLIWKGSLVIKEESAHTFLIEPDPSVPTFEFLSAFSPKPIAVDFDGFEKAKKECITHWENFWCSGGAIDLSESSDPRWRELERRIVLSQYLLAVNEAGSLPPAESGLLDNSGWSGKFHLEMHWWHGVQYALWNRWSLLDRSLAWYHHTIPAARNIAQQQGFRGVRWGKMVGPEGCDAPSTIGPILIWQQPHPIYYAYLDYRLHPTRETLERWREIVFETAEFMASFAQFDEVAGNYALNSPLKTVPENSPEHTTRNPVFELSYWRFGLRIAQEWREHLGLDRDAEWEKVLQGLAPLPVHDGLYLFQEGVTDTYTAWNWEHPSVIGMRGMLPGDGVDPTVMQATVRKVCECWTWRSCWAWDFPMIAMAAARNSEPKLAVEALFNPSSKNGFAANGCSTGGHNASPYFPGNGGLLAAVAMMAAGWDGAPERHAPGFPDDGSWTVRWEGLNPIP